MPFQCLSCQCGSSHVQQTWALSHNSVNEMVSQKASPLNVHSIPCLISVSPQTINSRMCYLYLVVPWLGYGWLWFGIYWFARSLVIPVSQATNHWLGLIYKPHEPATMFTSWKFMNHSLNHFKPAQAMQWLGAFFVASSVACQILWISLLVGYCTIHYG